MKLNPSKISQNKEDKIMRTFVLFLALVAFFFTSCSTTYYSTTPPVYDDVYYTAQQVTPTPMQTVTPSSQSQGNYYAEGEYLSDESVYDAYQPDYSDTSSSGGNTYITNNYYGYDYASRIRRFHQPYYFDDYWSGYYTNPYFYYPSYGGFNFSLGFNWGWGSFGWGYPYYGYYPSYYWDPWYDWYSPYYSWGYPYYGYGSYWNGFWDGYYTGLWVGNKYYDYYDGYPGFYYGHRSSRGSTNSSNGGGRGSDGTAGGSARPGRTGVEQSTLTERSDSYEQIPSQTSGNSKSVNPNQSRSSAVINPVPVVSDDPGQTGKNKATISSSSSQVTPVQKNTTFRNSNNADNQFAGQKEQYTKPPVEQKNAREFQSPIYRYEQNKNQTNVTREQSTLKTYRSPQYTKPKSSQEYNSPRAGNIGQYNPPRQDANSQVPAPAPSYQNRSVTHPDSYNNTRPAQLNNRNYSMPAPSNNRTFSVPSRSGNNFSIPSRSNNSYSAPSRSSSSYSMPSSSGGGGSSSRSGSSSSGGGRR